MHLNLLISFYFHALFQFVKSLRMSSTQQYFVFISRFSFLLPSLSLSLYSYPPVKILNFTLIWPFHSSI